MSASNSSNVPQGFSIYQPTLGAQLQFFPAMGTQELDQLIHAFLPGTATVQEKRASVALDFFEHIQLTGESFKFYPVYFMTTPVESPVNASPVQESGYASCFNGSPVMSNWDWSEISSSTSQASNSRQRRQSSKVPVSRHQTADFSHLPGMKIMTKDGQDVTNSASRGSKTKEQRDHAHLMRIIKACDACRKKKIRCDPSHKKRSVAQAQTVPAQKNAKKSKTKAPSQQIATPIVVENDFSTSFASFDVSASFATAELNSASPAATTFQSWEDLIQYPADTIPEEDYDFFHDPQGLFSSPESLTMSSSKPDTPVSEQYLPLATGINLQPQPESQRLPYNQSESIHDYVDFNLYSPTSSCSSLSTSSPKPAVPDLREENPGGVQQWNSDFGLMTSSDQVQQAISFIGSGLSSAENISTLTESPTSAAMSLSRQDYYAIADTHLDDYSVDEDANHSLAQSQHRDGDYQSTEDDNADTGAMLNYVSSTGVIATEVIATEVIATSAANGDVNVYDAQPSLAGLAAPVWEQQQSSTVHRRQDYSQLNLVGARRRGIASAYVDDGTIIDTTTTPAIETLPTYGTPTTAIATSAQDAQSTRQSDLETVQTLQTGQTLQAVQTLQTGQTLPGQALQTTEAPIATYATTSEIATTSATTSETEATSIGERIYLSSTDAKSLPCSSLCIAGILVVGYTSASQSAEQWLLTIMSGILLAVVLCISHDVMNTIGSQEPQHEQTYGPKGSKVYSGRTASVYSPSCWEALRCQASAVTQSVGRMMSLTGRSLAL